SGCGRRRGPCRPLRIDSTAQPPPAPSRRARTRKRRGSSTALLLVALLGSGRAGRRCAASGSLLSTALSQTSRDRCRRGPAGLRLGLLGAASAEVGRGALSRVGAFLVHLLPEPVRAGRHVDVLDPERAEG